MKNSSTAGRHLAPATPLALQGAGLRMRSHLALLVTAALVPLIIFSAVLMFIQIQHARSTKSGLLETMAEEAAERVDDQLRRTVTGLQALAQSDALSNQDLRAFHDLAGRLVKAEHWDHLALLGPGGEHLVNTRRPFGAALPPLNRPDLPMEVAASGRPLVSDMMKGALSDGVLTALYVPVVQRQTVKYVIAVAIESTTWQKLIQDQMGRRGEMHAMLLDRYSKIIASGDQGALELAGTSVRTVSSDLPAGIRTVSFDAPASERASSSEQVDTINGQRAYVASHKADFSGWTVVAFAPVDAFDGPLRQMAVVMGTGFLLLLLLGLGLALLLGRGTANSMSQLVASVRAVAAGGAPLPIKSHIAEVTQASHAVNEAAGLLAARRSELEAADQAKNAFLALLGHELRNPLAPIRNAVQIMKQAGPGSEASRRAVSVVDRQSAHLSRLVDDLLDVTRIDHGKIELRREVLDLRQLLQSAVQDHRGVLEQAGLRSALDVPPTAVLANCDRIRIAQAIGNLLHNATKFTPRGGRIAIRLEQDGRKAIVEVCDTGSGISPENLERIFDLFSQEQPSGVGGNSGLGIGLALTRKLVELHGGTATATSPGAGQGSSFRIELPAVVVAPADDAVAGAIGPALDNDNAGARVLVVDDNKDCADTLREMLALSGFASTVAYSGEAALLAVEREVPDAVLLDIGMPDIDGYEVCRRLRRSNIARQPVLIALTGWGQSKDRDMATAAGFDAHLTKPADADQVLAMLKESLRTAPATPLSSAGDVRCDLARHGPRMQAGQPVGDSRLAD